MSRLLMVSSNASLQPDYSNDKFRVSYGFKALVSGCKNWSIRLVMEIKMKATPTPSNIPPVMSKG
jgi:hypothetical protein